MPQKKSDLRSSTKDTQSELEPRNPSPGRYTGRVGVATTFSPRFLAVLSEAARISRLFDIPLALIHADEFSQEKEQRFREAIAQLNLPSDTPIHFRPSQHPADAIIEVQENHGIELLVAGALERETVHRHFTGNVARELLKRAPGDLFLFTNPKEKSTPIRHLFLASSDFSETTRKTFHQATDLAEKLNAESLTVLHVQTTFTEAKQRALGETSTDPEEQLHNLLDERHDSPIGLDYHFLRGNTGFTAFEYLQSSPADLLVIPSSRVDQPPVFPPVLDWILQVIPTNLWIVRKDSD
jgi:nucleotide-binding universal stress UspA family protein